MFSKAGQPYTGGIIDAHCHLLPGVDDGANSFAQTKSMLDIAAAEGITTIVVTPHLVCDGSEKAYAAKIRETFRAIQAMAADMGSPIHLILGYEVLLSPSLLHIDNLADYAIAGSNWLLVEPHLAEPPDALEELIYEAEHCGLRLILAHPERSHWLASRMDYLRDLAGRGILIQLNAGSVTGLWGKAVARSARRLVEQGLVHLIGTDAHSDSTRGPYARAALTMMSHWTSRAELECIAHGTAEHIFGLNSKSCGEAYDLLHLQHEKQLLP